MGDLSWSYNMTTHHQTARIKLRLCLLSYSLIRTSLDSALAHHACNTIKLLGRELLTSLLLIMAFSLTAIPWSLLIVRFRDSHRSMSIRCESTSLKKSSSDWLKSREVGCSIRVKRCDFVFFSVSRGSADPISRVKAILELVLMPFVYFLVFGFCS